MWLFRIITVSKAILTTLSLNYLLIASQCAVYDIYTMEDTAKKNNYNNKIKYKYSKYTVYISQASKLSSFSY